MNAMTQSIDQSKKIIQIVQRFEKFEVYYNSNFLFKDNEFEIINFLIQ